MARLHEWQWIQDHKAHYLADPEAAHDWDAAPAGHPGLVPTLLLYTHGRKSGEWRASPLLYQPCGVGFVIVGSRGGTDIHPAWYLNLKANPDCRVQVGRFRYRADAQFLNGEERARYWQKMVAFWPDFENYQKRTERLIPVVKLVATVETDQTG
jgi:deazaflavin-dependent oxidoreductase (nitroreductase family)